MKSHLHQGVLVCVAACLLAGGGCRRQAEHAERTSENHRNARRTPLVELYDKCKDSVVNIHMVEKVPTEDGFAYQGSWGSGWILHSAGYIITAEHVINAPGRHRVILPVAQDVIDAPRHRAILPAAQHFDCRVVVRYPSLDIALLKIERDEPFSAATLGRSDNVMVGELAGTIGNPTGLWNTFSVGIVTGLGRISGAADSYVYGMIQTDAGINHGNSGGPLLNALGEVIGVIDGIKSEAENIGFAIAIDQLRASFPDMISPEMRYGFILGLDVDTMTADAPVTSVVAGSPAAIAGFAVGDVITRVGEMDVGHGLDFYLALVDRSAGDELPITLTRNEQIIELSVTLDALALRPAAQQPESLTAGLKYEAFLGQWDELPDFDKLSPIRVGRIDAVTLPEVNEATVGIGLRMMGWLEVPVDGLYTFLLISDDGSRLFVGDTLLIDNDFLHMPQVKHGLIRLQAGMHPIMVEYFDGGGGKALGLSIEGPGLERQPVPPSMWFTEPLPEPPEIIDLPTTDLSDDSS